MRITALLRNRVVVAAAAALFPMMFSAASHAATSYTVSDGSNSTLVVAPNGNGNISYIVDGVDQFAGGGQESFFYSTGTGAAISLGTLPFVETFNTDGLFVGTYTDATDGLTFQLSDTLVGGTPGSGSSALGEVLTINNTNETGSVALHLYQYDDIRTNGTTANTLTLSGTPINTADVVSASGADYNVGAIADTTTGAPSEYQIGTGSGLLTLLTDGSAVTLNDNSTGPISSNPNFAFQYDDSLAAGGTFQLSLTESLSPGAVSVPLPNSAIMGLTTLGGIAVVGLLRRARRRTVAA